MADTERHDETARELDLGCGCDDNDAVDREMLGLALDDGQEVELPCGHTVSSPAAEYIDSVGEPDQQQLSDAESVLEQLRAVERPRWVDQRRDIDRERQHRDPVHEGRVMRVHARALGRQHDRGLDARPSRREVSAVVDELVPFNELGSLTDRARLREQVMARLADPRERIQARQRGRGGWSL